jgi:L-lactate utilization protein LutC
MADDSELDYIRTFLGAVHTAATVKQYSEEKTIDAIVDATYQRMLVYPGELINNSFNRYTKRFMVKISETSEANLTTAINNVLDGKETFNKRGTIAAYSKPSTMVHIEVVNTNKCFENPNTKRWYCDIYLDVDFTTS